jgi:hypothetical protein
MVVGSEDSEPNVVLGSTSEAALQIPSSHKELDF